MDNNAPSYLPFPPKLLYMLSNTSIMILLYSLDKQRLVISGQRSEWKLSRTDVRRQFAHVKGFGDNSTRAGFRQLRKLKILTSYKDHDKLNMEILRKFYEKE